VFINLFVLKSLKQKEKEKEEEEGDGPCMPTLRGRI
jgi:hypothetical protein